MDEGKFALSSIEKAYILDLLSEGKRMDGRKNTDFREIKIETNYIETAQGSALVKLGKTKVIAGVKIIPGFPYSDSPNKGTLTVVAELNPTASPQYRYGPPSAETIELSRVTDRIIRESECIDLEDLCIIEGKHVYSIYIDIYPLDDCGNLFDAAGLAAFAALATAHFPLVMVDSEGNLNPTEDTRPLKISSIPISITTYKIGKYHIFDPIYKEETVSTARLTFGFTEDHIVSGQKGGEGTFKAKEVHDIVKNALKQSQKVRTQIKAMLNLNQ